VECDPISFADRPRLFSSARTSSLFRRRAKHLEYRSYWLEPLKSDFDSFAKGQQAR